MNQTDTSAQHIERSEIFGHPTGLFILFFTELWERFSYYGMRAILVLYIISSASGDNPGMGWAEGNALALYGWYTMLVYVMSIPGGIIADKWLGQKRTVLFGGLTLVAGHSILAIEQDWAFFSGLALIILGVGGLKPNISTMVGGLYPPGDERRDSGFTIFYIGINIGAFLSALVVGYVGETIGWHYGFGLAGIGMLLGQVVYMMGQKHLKGVGEAPPKGAGPGTDSSVVRADKGGEAGGNLFLDIFRNTSSLIVTVLLIGLGIYIAVVNSIGYGLLTIALALGVGVLMVIYKEVDKIEKDRMVVLLLSFVIVTVFWGAFEQAGGLLNIYTKQQIDRIVSISTLDLVFYGGTAILVIRAIIAFARREEAKWLYAILAVVLGVIYTLLRAYELTDPFEIPASVFQSVNALFIIIFGTIVAGFWLWWKHRGHESSSLFKMATGTIIMGAGFIFMAVAAQEASAGVGAKGMLIWLILAYLLHTIGELCASPVALSFITKLAPIKYVSIMMGFYFAATGLGNKLAGTIGEAASAEPVTVELLADWGQISPFVTDSAFVADSVQHHSKNFRFTANIAVENNDIVITRDGEKINDFFNLEPKDKEVLRERIKDEGADKIYTAVMNFEKPEDKKEATKGKTEGYEADLQIFEIQNKREFWTFMLIFGFTAAFGLLLIMFLRKLKKLTHGAEEIEGTSHEEQENYEIADIQDKDKKQP